MLIRVPHFLYKKHELFYLCASFHLTFKTQLKIKLKQESRDWSAARLSFAEL